MSAKSKKRQNNRANQSLILSGVALSLVLFTTLCSGTQAVETSKESAKEASTQTSREVSQAGPDAAAKGGQSNLELQLDKYQKAIDEKTLSLADFQKLAELAGQNPTQARVHLLLGRGFDMQGLADQAVEQYQIADKYGPKDPEAIASILHSVISRGGGEAANTLLNSAIQRFPDNPKILYMIGKRLKEKRHYIEAGKALVKAYTSRVEIPGLPSELGDLLLDQDPLKAVALARQDLAANADFAPGLMLESKGLILLGNYELALAPLEKLYKQSPSNIDSTGNYVRCLYWCGDYQKALQPSFYCVRNDAHLIVSEINSATTLAKIIAHLPISYVTGALQNFYEETEEAKIPVNPPFHFYVGRIFYRQHKYPEAKTELLHYLDNDPKSAETLYMLGHIAEDQDHDYATALKDYRFAHALLPYHQGIALSCINLEERLSDNHSDWAWSLRNWLYSTFTWGQH